MSKNGLNFLSKTEQQPASAVEKYKLEAEQYSLEELRAKLKARGIQNVDTLDFTEVVNLVSRLAVYEIRYDRVDNPDALAKSIQLRNDLFRKAVFMVPRPDGRAFMTSTVENLAAETKAVLFDKIIAFDNFTQDNDPYGEHDFGCIELDGIPKIYWQINYYEDASMKARAADPLNAYRVLVVMFAEEY
ncbi:hypothetical protein C6499_22785 [Candidatus Poribacteria bacterium]|nr:MAG: hypothetical protein C6499_22785 [Candidatus Poribacteria bacterium]